MISGVGSQLTTPCYLTCSMITEVDTLLTTPCYLTCTMISEVGSQLTTPCYLTCSMITEAGSLLTTPCYLTCTMITEAGPLFTAPCCLTSRLEFGDRQPANAGQKYLLTCLPASGRQETAGQPVSRQSPKLQLILVHIYRLRVNLFQNQRKSFQFHYGSHVCKQNAHGAV